MKGFRIDERIGVSPQMEIPSIGRYFVEVTVAVDEGPGWPRTVKLEASYTSVRGEDMESARTHARVRLAEACKMTLEALAEEDAFGKTPAAETK